MADCMGGVNISGGRTHIKVRSAEEEGVVFARCAKVSTVDSSTQEHQIREGTINFGNDYENKVAALLLLSCLGDDIKNMSNASGYGVFDEIILYKETNNGKKHEYLLQLKCQLTPTCIQNQEFVKKNGAFCIQKYRDSVKIIQNDNIKYAQESGNVSHFEDIQENRTFILFTNRSLRHDTYFNNYLDTCHKKLHLTHYSNRLIFKFKPENFNAEFEERNQNSREDIFLFTEQTGVHELDAKIAKEILLLIKPIKVPDRLLADVPKKFVDFLNNWTTGGHYHLTKKIIWKVLGEELLASNMLTHEKQDCSNGNYETWNKIIAF